MTDPEFPASVRLPSHIEPPYRAQQWMNQLARGNFSAGFLFQTEWTRGDATVGTLGQFSQGPEFPPGMHGELTYLNFSAHSQAASIPFNAPWNVLDLDIFKNGTAVPGYRALKPEFESSIVVAGFTRTLRAEGPRVLAPIHLEEGDRLDLQISFTGTSTTWFASLSWGGWLYPVLTAGDSGSIRGTQQDPRARQPLGRPRGRW